MIVWMSYVYTPYVSNVNIGTSLVTTANVQNCLRNKVTLQIHIKQRKKKQTKNPRNEFLN